MPIRMQDLATKGFYAETVLREIAMNSIEYYAYFMPGNRCFYLKNLEKTHHSLMRKYTMISAIPITKPMAL